MSRPTPGEIARHAAIRCNLDFNSAIGRNLAEKLQVVYVALYRVAHLHRVRTGVLPDTLLLHPVTVAALDIAGHMTKGEAANKISLPYAGAAWGRFSSYLVDDPATEHHLLLTAAGPEGLPTDPREWCKLSLSNFIMSNNFGYYNLD